MDFSQVKLRKTEVVEKKIAPNEVFCNNSEDYAKLMSETYLEKYIDIIKPWTFKSSFIPLSLHTIESLVHHFNLFSKNPASRSEWETNESLQKLAADIDAAKKEMGVPEIFIRLSSRSPKDAALTHPEFRDILKRETDLVTAETEKILEEDKSIPRVSQVNIKLHALYRASTYVLSSKSGREAVDLLVTSPRIQDDMVTMIKNPDNATPLQAVVREFQFFDVTFELRGFVYGKKLTAITQYNEFIYFPRLLKEKARVEDKIKEFFEQHMIPAIRELDNYVIDFILIESGGDFKVYVVELNPFAEFAGGGMFSWVHDIDVLMGKKPFEFRIGTKSASAQTIKSMASEWADWAIS